MISERASFLGSGFHRLTVVPPQTYVLTRLLARTSRISTMATARLPKPQFLRAGLAAFDRYCRSSRGAPFRELSHVDQVSSLIDVETGALGQMPVPPAGQPQADQSATREAAGSAAPGFSFNE